VRLIDLREDRRARAEERSGDGEAASQPPVGAGVLSKELIDALGQRLVRDEQVILFINRRGFSPFLLCRDCGFSPRCPMCDVTLTYHRGMSLLRCHHCGYAQAVDDACPKCHGVRLLPFGVGTEKVEEAVRELFPEARTLRMDRDTTVRKGTHAQILRSFRNGEADILIGTQMVAKGLDFPRVTLVGVVNADTALNLPDYHAGERAFQLLTQVAGRSGRGETPGEVLVQTFNPEDRTLELAAQQDYVSFYSEEIVQREAVRYPPFAHLANLVFSDEIEGETSRRALAMAECVKIASDEMKMGKRVEVLGPVACALSRLRGKYRWHLVVRTINAKLLRTVVKAAIEKVPAGDRAGLSLDIDPITML
jgi:primosomal protein N' (replication factor Y)